jgi:phosphate transport system protein
MSDVNFETSRHIDKSYDSKLKRISADIVKMGEIVLEMLAVVRKSLDSENKQLVEDSRALDRKLNVLDFNVQKEATTVIALRQPMGVDLRFVISVLKISSSLERMGDLAKSSVRKATRFSEAIDSAISRDLKEMLALANTMVTDVISAFRDMSSEKALKVMDQDDAVDDIYHRLLDDVRKHAEKNPKVIPAFADIIFAAKNMERIGDHCTKMADLVHYIDSGERVGKVANHKKQAAEAKEKESAAE